jgi:hypothetical protein
VNGERQETEFENLLILEDRVLMCLVLVGSCEPDTSCTHARRARIICTGVSGAYAHRHFSHAYMHAHLYVNATNRNTRTLRLHTLTLNTCTLCI